MLTTITNCPVCNGQDFGKKRAVKDHSISKEVFNIDTCITCGFQFTNPIPTKDTIGIYYESQDYISHSDTNKGIVNKLYHWVRKRSNQSKIALVNAQSKTKKILDIGCGTGYFLKACQEVGWEVEGMEPDDKARLLATENIGKKVYKQLEDINGKQFSVISLWHVLEHIHELDKTLTKITSLLQSKGTLIIAVPNIESYDALHYKEDWAALDVPRHLYHFRKEDMIRLIENQGFKLKEIKPMVFDSFYVSMLSEKYQNGKTNYLKAFIVGMLSNSNARKTMNYSSLIYSATKND